VVLLADLEQRIGPAARLRPPAVEVFAQGAAADCARAVIFAVVIASAFDFDDDGHGGGFGVRANGGPPIRGHGQSTVRR
jgi:hypothetical protein